MGLSLQETMLQPFMLVGLRYTFTKISLFSPRCHDFVVNSLDPLMSLGNFKTKPKVNGKEM